SFNREHLDRIGDQAADEDDQAEDQNVLELGHEVLGQGAGGELILFSRNHEFSFLAPKLPY
ncbi:MAG: hypothetical protein KDD68_18230, partial [Bdellovibrionales bacterium]|nr:hypothetical protein [Bdellovibrionales bacterium]